MRILVVDDDPLVRDALTELLKSENHQVTCAAQGSTALATALTHDFDLVVCDILLPDFDGVEVIRAVKAQAPQLPVVVVSGADPNQWHKRCEDAGAATFLEKPVLPATILREVNMVLKARLTLRVALVDTDSIHRTRLTKLLSGIGCDIRAFSSAAEALQSFGEDANFSLWVADAGDPNIFDLLKSVQSKQVPVFVFATTQDSKQEENLMRAGAALILSKPIDVDTLLTQASFLAR